MKGFIGFFLNVSFNSVAHLAAFRQELFGTQPPRKSKWPQSDRNSSKHQPPAKVNDCTPTETIRNANPLAKVIGCSRRRPLAAAAAKRAKGRGQHRCRRCGEPRRSRSTTARGGRMQRRARATNRQPPPPPQARGRCTTGSASMLLGLLDKLTCLLSTPRPPQEGLTATPLYSPSPGA